MCLLFQFAVVLSFFFSWHANLPWATCTHLQGLWFWPTARTKTYPTNYISEHGGSLPVAVLNKHNSIVWTFPHTWISPKTQCIRHVQRIINATTSARPPTFARVRLVNSRSLFDTCIALTDFLYHGFLVMIFCSFTLISFSLFLFLRFRIIVMWLLAVVLMFCSFEASPTLPTIVL